MIYNNVIAFFSNILLRFSLFMLSFSLFYNTSQVSSVAELNRRTRIENIKQWVLFLILILAYYLIGKKVLRPQGNLIKNFISVSSIAIIGLALCLLSSSGYRNAEGLLGVGWLLLVPIGNFKTNWIIGSLPAIFIPTLIMGLSIRRKESEKEN